MIRLVKSTFYNENKTKKELNRFISKAKILSFGTECQKFERSFAKWQGRKECVLVNSGSSANLALIQSLINLGKIKTGDYVGFSALTWSTNVMPLIELGLKPIPIDVELDTLNISSKKVLETLKKYPIKVLFITNLLGLCDDIEEIEKICIKTKILLLEDNCESLGTKYKGKLLGNYSLASTFSFYVGHHMSTIEGGAICTDSSRLATMLRIVRAHGWDRNLSNKNQTKIRAKYKVNETFYSRYTFYELGYNFRPTELVGFLGSNQLQYLNEIILKRNKNFLTLAAKIYSNSEYYPIKYLHIDYVSNFAFPIICKSEKLRSELVEKCNKIVELRPIVGGDMTEQPFFLKQVKTNPFSCPNARLIHRNGMYFGNNPELTRSEINKLLSLFDSKNL